jgi:hypothetical protein
MYGNKTSVLCHVLVYCTTAIIFFDEVDQFRGEPQVKYEILCTEP